MHELFGTKKYINIDLFYKMVKTNGGDMLPIVITEDEYNKLKADEKTKDTVKSLHTEWKMPTWKAANDLLQLSTAFNYHTQQMDTDWNKYRDHRLKALMVAWDAKMPDGEPIPCNEEWIGELHQNIALALIDRYNELTRVSQEDKAKN